jgi:mono/diheme cytochrome c family protein
MWTGSIRRSLWARIFPTAFVGTFLLGCASMAVLEQDDGIRAVKDADVIARGRNLVYGPAHCASCHGDPARLAELRAGREIPLSGGRVFELGTLGRMVAPNLTSDPETGIGARTDEELVRHLRYGISAEGRALAPFMAFRNLADDDLRAIISFLRTLPPVRNETDHDLNMVGRIVVDHLLQPQQPETPPPTTMNPAPTAEYGRYLAQTVANCNGCHTRRSKLTGAFIGRPFAGGMELKEGGKTFVVPDIRPIGDGIVAGMSESQFISVFRARGSAPGDSPMPWEAYARMTDTDLLAIRAYLFSLPAEPG